MYRWDWNTVLAFKSVFLSGAVVTLELTLFIVVVGTSLGVFFAFLKQAKNPLFVWAANIYIELFRTLPILVVIIWIFYVAPILFEWRINSFLAAGLALSFHLSAFVAETTRAAIQSIPRSQFESGLALGLNHRQVMTKIVIPQATRNMIPNLLGLYINELKNTSLASIIAVNELLHQSNILISQTFRPLEVYSITALMYLIIILPLVFFARFLEQRFTKGEKPTFRVEYETGS